MLSPAAQSLVLLGSPRWCPCVCGRPSGLFPSLVIINKATRHSHIQVFLCRCMFLLPLGENPGVEVLGCKVYVHQKRPTSQVTLRFLRAVSNVGSSRAASLPASATATFLFLKSLPETHGGFSLCLSFFFFLKRGQGQRERF